MKLSNQTNAHGALWNINSYNYAICHDQIFGVSFTGQNPHECNNNKVLNKIRPQITPTPK
jgi:hypothetical protein